MENVTYNPTYKVILLGERVGKSSFLVRYRDGRFVENLSVDLKKTRRAIQTITYMDNDQKIEVNVRLLF